LKSEAVKSPASGGRKKRWFGYIFVLCRLDTGHFQASEFIPWHFNPWCFLPQTEPDTRNIMIKSKRPALLLLPGTLAALAAGCGQRSEETHPETKPLPTLQVAAVTRGTLEKQLPATGTLQALPGQEATLSPPVTGILSGLFVQTGQTVAPGQIIAKLGTQQLVGQIEQAQATIGQNQVQVQQAVANALQQSAQTQASILQAQAGLRNAQAALAGAQATLTGTEAAASNARQNLSREQTLFADGLVPQKEVEAVQLALRTAESQEQAQQQAVAGQRQTIAGQKATVVAARAAALQDIVKRQDVQVARQQLRNAQGALATAHSQLALYTLRSPLAGQVSFVGASVGETVDTTTKIAVITNLKALQLTISLTGDAVASVHPGQALTFTVSSLPGHVFRTSIGTIAQRVDPATGTVPALALVANPNHLLKDDTTARVEIVTERHANILIVPRVAILTDPDTGETSVISVGSDNVAHTVPIKIGWSVGEQVEIQSGLSVGQSVAVSGQYGLPDGTKVQVQHGS
jgi:RND family efflux transporter MFP subunit